MQFDDVEKKVMRRPFKPFRIYLTDGTAYEVRHPEMILLGRRSAVIGLAADPQQKFYDRSVDVDLLHIVRVDDVEVAAGPNGPAAGPSV